MDDNRIEIVARLDTSRAAVVKIEADLSKITDQLNKDQALKIIANVDLGKTTQRINSQLATIGKNLNLNIPKIELGMADGGGTALINNVDHIVDDVTDKILELKQNLAKEFSVNIDKIITNTVKNARGQISSFSFDLTKLSGDVEKFNYTVSRTKQKDKENGKDYTVTSVKQTSSRDSDRGAIKLLERQEAQVDKLTQKLAKLKAGFDNANAPRPILNQDNINQLNEEYSKTDKIIKNIGKSTSETFDKMVSDANKAISVYENLGKTMRDAENTATDFASNNINSAKSLLGGKIDNFITTVSKSSVADANSIIKSAESIKKSLDGIGDTQGLKTARDSFNELRGQFNSFDAAVKKSSFEKTHKAKVEQLAADMNRYAEANKQAIASTKQMSNGTSFLDKWNNLVSEMAKGMDLTEDEVKHLREQLRLFGKEAEAQGLKGESAWGKFLNSFKTMSSYITANMVFNFVKRQLRDMVNEVTAIDTAMTELRKVTTASDEEFEQFAKSAGKTGRELGASISDVIDATATFARLGESLPDAEELGRVATLYKNVGDGISAETAAEDIISTMKAFKIEAKDAIKIVDKFNEVSNSFAISSGGIGEALKRSASALAAANNDISESIALITTANTIAQDPTTVGQGIKTVSLRLRSTKTELEEMGEDAEGAAENVSKLREQMIALTGVDIQLDDSTYKSTYQILLEISKVWGQLDDLSRSSVLEQLFGKRQANIGAAILENGKLLQEVYQTSEGSAGSAMREQEKYAESIKYSIDTLKASYQDFAQTVINSDFVQDVLKTAQKFLEVLTKIIDKFGTLPTLIAGISAIGSFKGRGIFGTVVDDVDKSTKHLTIFKKEVSQIKDDLKNPNTTGLSKVASAFDTVKIRAIATEVAVSALNAAISFGLSMAISATVSGISKWLNKEKEAAEQAEKLRQEMEERRKATVENIRAYEEETDEVNELVGQYIRLVSSTDDLNSIKDDLAKVQDQVIQKYGAEADAIDMVNGKIEENIDWLVKQEEQQNKDWLRENAKGIDEARKYFEDSSASDDYLLNFSGKERSDYQTAAEVEAKRYYEDLREAFKKLDISDLLEEWEASEEGFYRDGQRKWNFGFTLKEGLAPQEQLDTIEKIIEAYEELDKKYSGTSFNEYYNLSSGSNRTELISLRDQMREYLEILNKAESVQNNLSDLESLLGGEDLELYNSTIEKLTKYAQERQNADLLPVQRYGAGQALKQQEDVLESLIAKYPALQKQAETALKGIGLSISKLSTDEQSLYDEFIKSLDETHKVALGNIDKLESAMASAIKGEGLSHDSAWELLKLDTDKLLKPVIDSAGKYHFELDDIVALKDSIIDKNRTLIEQEMQEVQLKKQEADSELQVLQMEMTRVNTRIRNEASGNTRPTEELVRKQADLRQQIESLTKSSKAYGDEIERDSILIKEYNAHSGNLLNTEKMLQAQIDALKKSQEQLKTEISDLNTQADKMLKAQEMKIDGIVDGLEAESKELEDSKQLLEDQLDVLEEQKEELDEIVKNYETIASVVDNTVSKQIDELEKNRQSIEDYYNDLINKLKEENSERADALDYAEKLAALENAKNNKVRVYGTGTGWTYKVDQDALVKAQRALEDADTNKAVSELEKERDKAISGFDEQIKAFEDYADEWKDTVEEIRNQEDERLTAEILGSDWREKIASKDIDVLKNYRSEYRNYNAQLKSITDNEIKNLKASIDAKNKEIETKKKQIQVWNDYKSSVQNAVKSIKDSLDGYDELLNNIMLDENSTYEQRQANLNNFANKYSDIISQINRKNSELDTTTNKISNLNRQITELNNNPITIESNLSDAADEMAEFIDQYRDAIEAMRKRLDDTVTGYGVVNSAWDEKLAQAANAMRRMGSYSQGGSVAYTGLAQVHGSPNKSETVFNASQSKELWDMVRTGNFTNLVADRAIKGVSSVLNNNTSNLNNSRVININGMVIKADNPKQFHDQFMAEINKYWSVQLTESPIR